MNQVNRAGLRPEVMVLEEKTPAYWSAETTSDGGHRPFRGQPFVVGELPLPL